MSEIKCPHCGEVFQVDESGYQEIVRQVRSAEFARELEEREQMARASQERAVELAVAQERAQAERASSERDVRIAQLEGQLAAAQQREAAQQQEAKDATQLALSQQRSELEARIAQLEARAAQVEETAEARQQLAVQEAVEALKDQRAQLERELDAQRSQVSQLQVEAKRSAAAHELELKDKLAAKDLLIADREAEIERIRDMRSKLNTKLLGESLEQHCEVAFNQLRATAFRNATFEKDTDKSRSSLGDYIFREHGEDGTEFVSIMFEMKTQEEGARYHKKNEDHLAKLDRDRRAAGCEYAVLVSTLEPDSELYNTGIVDVSWLYDKMYVIRPQFFIPMISVLRNAALASLDYRRELAAARQQNIDVTNFEESLDAFKDAFLRNYRLASERFEDAIKDIDRTIKLLEKIRDSLTKSGKHLTAANNKLEDLSVKRLVRDNPTMRDAFEQAR